MGYVSCMEDEDERKDDFWNSTVNTSSSCEQSEIAIQQSLRERLEGAEKALFRAETQLRREIEQRREAEDKAELALLHVEKVQETSSEAEQRVVELEREIEALKRENKALNTQIRRARERLASYQWEKDQAQKASNSFADQLTAVKPILSNQENGQKSRQVTSSTEALHPSPDPGNSEAMERMMTAHFGPRQKGRK